MGAERWLEFAPGEKEKVLAYLGDETWLGQEGKWGWWIEWKDEVYSCDCEENCDCVPWGGPRLEVGYQMSAYSSDAAPFVCRELAKRFEVTRIGSDSVGWYDDENWASDDERAAKSRYGEYVSWAAWVRDFRAEWCHTYAGWKKYGGFSEAELSKTLSYMQEAEAYVVAWFEALDAKQSARMGIEGDS
jgi:hypothetical protein